MATLTTLFDQLVGVMVRTASIFSTQDVAAGQKGLMKGAAFLISISLT